MDWRGVLNNLTAGVNGWEAAAVGGTPILPTVDDNARLIVSPYCHRQGIAPGSIQAAALGIGGTAVLIPAVGVSFLGLVDWEINASAATVITLESPAATVKWQWPISVANGSIVISRRIPLFGANGQPWTLRSSAAATVTANGIAVAQK